MTGSQPSDLVVAIARVRSDSAASGPAGATSATREPARSDLGNRIEAHTHNECAASTQPWRKRLALHVRSVWPCRWTRSGSEWRRRQTSGGDGGAHAGSIKQSGRRDERLIEEFLEPVEERAQ